MTFGETVWVLPRTATGVDVHGNQTVSWPDSPSHADAVQVDNVAVAGRVRLDNEPDLPNREAVITRFDVYMPAGTDVKAVDRMWIRGDVYDVVGEPFAWRSPYSGREPGVQATVERIEG